MKTNTRKTNAGANGPGDLSKCPNHIGQQQRSEDTTELMLFGSFVDCLTDFELKFLVHHYNHGLPLGRTITMADIKMFPISEIIPFIKSINVGSIGQSVVDCINAKMAAKNII
jgi:hypothetical protein